MLVWLISHSRAIAARRASSTAFWLITGSVPGIPQHTGQVELLGGEIVLSTTAQEQNIFERVDSSTCTSNPISMLYFVNLNTCVCFNQLIIVCKEVYVFSDEELWFYF